MTASGEVLKIELTKGHHAIIYKEDFEKIVGRSWHYSNGYAYTNTKGARTRIAMHRIIVDVADSDFVVDHINGDKLDNRRSNLRVCTKSENNRNRKLNKSSSVHYKGVYVNKNKFMAYITFNYKMHYLGVFNTAKEAAKAYDREAVKLHGDYARLNFPESLEQIKRQLSNTLFN